MNLALHATLYPCPDCDTYWEEFERYAVAVTDAEARRDYPHRFA